MSIALNILASYRRPGTVMRRLLSEGENEPRALVTLMSACAVIFVAQWPKLARQSHLEGTELNALLGASLMAWIMLAPLMLYALAFIVHLIARALGGKGSAYGSRLALFWALLACAPLILFEGLVGGFVGPGPSLQIVGMVWLAAFVLIWIAGLRAAHRPEGTS